MAKNKQQAPKGVLKNVVWLFIAFLVFASALSLVNYSPTAEPVQTGISQIAEKIKEGQVEKIEVEDNTTIRVILTGEETPALESSKEASESLETLLTAYGLTAEQITVANIVVKEAGGWKFFFTNIFPVALPILFVLLFLWVMLRQVQGGNNRALMFGQTRAQAVDPNQKKHKTTFAEVAGAAEAKEELMEVVDFLKHPKKFTALGAKIPKGVLLMGAPGTGKTLLARAVAGEANVPFFHISGSEFVEMFVGVGASRVRDIFKKAKKASPAILFIDEIDAVGRQRGTGMGGSHDEREQTLNQILTEMDGFEVEDNVIVVAATNRPDVLDPALLRPGRFDRRVVIDLPDITDRTEILGVHGKNKLFTKEVNLRELAKRTTGFSGADLMNLLNEAAISAARYNKKKISMRDCLEAIDKVLLGPQRKNPRYSQHEKAVTAYHEGGHALMAYMLEDSDPVHKVTIIPRGRAGGYTLKLPEEDKKLHSRKELLADIAVSLGGHAAEMLQFGDMTTGASNDLGKATKVARQLVTQYGMSDKLGPRTFGETNDMIFLGKEIHEQRDYSEKTAEAIDGEVDRIIEEQYTMVKEMLRKEKSKLDKIAETLIQVETLEREEFEELLEGPKPKETNTTTDENDGADDAPAAQISSAPSAA